MHEIKIADTTMCFQEKELTFKEKLEIARLLQNLSVDIIELPEIMDEKVDSLLIKTVSSFVKDSIISVCATNEKTVAMAAQALKDIPNSRIRIELPVSPVNMEYMCHKKPAKMIETVKNLVSFAKESIDDVEFSAFDATRAEEDFLSDIISAATESGASTITVCDSACQLFPDDFANFIEGIVENCDATVGVYCDDRNSLACASSALSVVKGAAVIKTSVNGDATPLLSFANMLRDLGANYDISSNIKYTQMRRTTRQIEAIAEKEIDTLKNVTTISVENNQIHLDSNDSKEDVVAVVKTLGYDLSQEDEDKVYEEFQRASRKTDIGVRELDAIIRNSAMQVPSVYKIISYVINSGNVINASAQIQIEKDGVQLSGIANGNGPIDAAFNALEQIMGKTYELDDFQIKSVNQGTEALGHAIVKLRTQNGIYSGGGISTDIIGASIRAYVSAVNKIVYEEA